MTFDLNLFLRLLGISSFSVVLSAALFLIKSKTPFKRLPETAQQIIIGILFGCAAICGTEFGVDVGGATANARDAAPLCAGIIFGGPAGIIAGLIGGIERWFAAAWGAGTYSRAACTVSTIFAGFYAAFLRKYIFENKRPGGLMAFFTGGVMEIIHMTVLFLTHLTDPAGAFEVVKICTVPMIACNGISVMASVIIIKMINRDYSGEGRKHRNISQRVQTPLLIAVVTAFLVSTAFVFVLQTYSSLENAKAMMKLNSEDVKQDILDASDENLLSIARQVAAELETQGNYSLPLLALKYGVADIYIVDRNGIVVGATDGNTGFDMHSDSDLPEAEQQSSRFLVLLTGEADEYVQEYMPLTADRTVRRKLAGIALENGGFVQVGYDAGMFQDEVSRQVRTATQNRHIGENGHMIIADKSLAIVSSSLDGQWNDLASLGIRIDPSALPEDLVKAEVAGADSYYSVSEAEGYYIVAVMTAEEIFSTRNAMAYINSYMEILIYAVLFILIFLILKHAVVDKLHSVNEGLGKIMKGDLDTVIDVRYTDEFSSLSNDINSTVSTLKRYISEAETRMAAELELAKRIQEAALPAVSQDMKDRSDFSLFAAMDAAKEVGGDFYDFYMLDDSRMVILIADVSGKGIPAAMFMMTAKTLLKNLTQRGLSPGEVFTKANSELCANNEAQMFITAWMGIADLKTGQIEFTNAGHNPPVWLKKDGSCALFKSKAGFVLAGMEGLSYKTLTMQLDRGDRFLLYTDGVTEAFSSDGSLYGEERLLSFMKDCAGLDAEQAARALRADILTFADGAEQADDITMLFFDYYRSEAKDPMNEREYDAKESSFAAAQAFVEESLEAAGADMKASMQILIAFEEIFINVVQYAYPPDEGKVFVGISTEEGKAVVRIRDMGIPFDPLKKEDPKVGEAETYQSVGGFGIFMAKNIMDDVSYEHKDGQNIVTMTKKI